MFIPIEKGKYSSVQTEIQFAAGQEHVNLLTLMVMCVGCGFPHEGMGAIPFLHTNLIPIMQ